MESYVKPFERLNTPDDDEVIGTNIIVVFQVLYIARATVVSADSVLIILPCSYYMENLFPASSLIKFQP